MATQNRGSLYAHGGRIFSILAAEGQSPKTRDDIAPITERWRFTIRRADQEPSIEPPKIALTYNQVNDQLKQAEAAHALNDFVVELWIDGVLHNTVSGQRWLITPIPWSIMDGWLQGVDDAD